MSGYKHIETTFARFIAGRYRSVVEAGAGENIHAARLIQRAGTKVTCIDLFVPPGILPVPYLICDVSDPDYSLFTGVDCIYSIRPVEEMMEPLIRLASAVNADLIVYHLGFEGYPYPRIVIDCGIPLSRYVTRQN
jgi:uncharacterized UPF0146 family protein